MSLPESAVLPNLDPRLMPAKKKRGSKAKAREANHKDEDDKCSDKDDKCSDKDDNA